MNPAVIILVKHIGVVKRKQGFTFHILTRSQAVARVADRTVSQQTIQ